MSYTFFVLPESFDELRVEIFLRMQEERLLASCMHSYKNPTVQDWMSLTDPSKAWLLCCVPCCEKVHDTKSLCAVALLTPWRGRAWTFDFTVFRQHFANAASMSMAMLKWVFENAPCESLVGLCAKSNTHAWRLAKKAGFNNLGNVAGACFQAKRNVYEDAVLVLAKKSDFC